MVAKARQTRCTHVTGDDAAKSGHYLKVAIPTSSNVSVTAVPRAGRPRDPAEIAGIGVPMAATDR
jgi:hypothetical protein